MVRCCSHTRLLFHSLRSHPLAPLVCCLPAFTPACVLAHPLARSLARLLACLLACSARFAHRCGRDHNSNVLGGLFAWRLLARTHYGCSHDGVWVRSLLARSPTLSLLPAFSPDCPLVRRSPAFTPAYVLAHPLTGSLARLLACPIARSRACWPVCLPLARTASEYRCVCSQRAVRVRIATRPRTPRPTLRLCVCFCRSALIRPTIHTPTRPARTCLREQVHLLR